MAAVGIKGSTQTRRNATSALIAFLLAALCLPFGAGAALAATIPTTTTVTGPSSPVSAPDLVPVTVQITPAPQEQDGFIPAAAVYVDGVFAGQGPIAPDGTVAFQLAMAPGTHSVYGSFSGFNDYEVSQSDPISIDVGSATTTTLTSSKEPALQTESVTYTATVGGKFGSPTPADPPVGGTLTITDTTTATVLGTLVVTAEARTLAVTTTLAIGSHDLLAEYSGAGLYGASSAPLTQTIQADLAVDATGVGISASAFYPVVDGYRDTILVRGSRHEPISAAIRIYSVTTGKLVRSVNLPSASDPYSWAWNGRSNAGTLQPAGKYRVVQTLTDSASNHLTVTAYTTISLKRLYFHSVTIAKNGDQYSIYGDPGNGSVSQSASSYARGVRLASGSSWVAVSYAFTMPSATVYRTISFKVLGRSTNGTKSSIGIWNPGWGSYAYVSSYSQAKAVGPGYGWYTTSGPGSALHSGRTARAVVFAEYGPGGKVFDVSKVSLVVSYGVLR